MTIEVFLPQSTNEQKLIARELGHICERDPEDGSKSECRRGDDGTGQDGEYDGVDADDPEGSFLLPSWPKLQDPSSVGSADQGIR